MKKQIVFLWLFIFITGFLHADEGMWLPMYLKKLNEKQMKEMGMKISAEDIYSVTGPSLTDAIVSLGGFCTGEIISPRGLMLTNHHCAYSQIASHSNVTNNYLENGFWAATLSDELPNPGLTASILISMDNVTQAIENAINGTSEGMAHLALQSAIDSIKRAQTENTHYTADVKSLFNENEYYVFVYEVFRDVRLVGAPPSSIGKFGGDTDNWMWPRHTGDFTLMRIYSAPDGTPAEYNLENIPYTPRHYFPISLKGFQEGDFSMIIGFPGRTERYLTSREINMNNTYTMPSNVEMLGTVLSSMKKHMDASEEIRIMYASNYASLSNYHKYMIGQLNGLNQYELEADLREQEEEMKQWINADATRADTYGEMFKNYQSAYDALLMVQPSVNYYNMSFVAKTISYGAAVWRLHNYFETLEKRENPSEEQLESFRNRMEGYFSETNLETEKSILKSTLQLMNERIPRHQQPEVLAEIIRKGKGKTDAEKINNHVDRIFQRSIFLNKQQTEAFLENPNAKRLANDPLQELSGGIITTYRGEIMPAANASQQYLEQSKKLYMQALREWQSDKPFYPDANSTLRVVYGTVQSYIPRDAVHYNFYTTHFGLLEKEDNNDPEFIVPEKLNRLLNSKDFGRYSYNDTLVINFLSTQDITGGNSGSPVIDAEGNLIGCAFDGNWESMISDLLVVPEVNRTISVDVRYILFVIDKFAEARHLLDEMDIIDARQVGSDRSERLDPTINR